jgi:type II secretory pathway pseudopilin PulG
LQSLLLLLWFIIGAKMHKRKGWDQGGFTLVELTVSFVVLGIIAISILGLFTALVKSAVVTRRKAVASTLATNQMEYLKSLPYNSLAVAGGAIIATNPLPATTTQKLNGVTYTIKTSINYVDDAFDGCGSYPTQALKQTYCRNYPPPSGAPVADLNPADYKIIHVSVYDVTNLKLAEVDTQVSARVAETASTTGALFVKIIDSNGNPLPGATVQVTDTTVTPNVSVSDSTDTNGTAIFYGLTPDTTGYDYSITGSLSGYSTLTTIAPSGSFQPNYPNQQIFTQQSSFVTLTLKPQGANSLVIEAVDTSGNPLNAMKVYVKGGYKKYTSAADTAYYYDTMTPSDIRPTTDSGGLAALSNLVPGTYIFCGDTGAINCKIGSTTYYLAAAVSYGGVNPFNPVVVPTYTPSSPPATTFTYNSVNYLQKVRLIFSASSSFPRVNTLSPYDASKTGGTINSFAFQINGSNLPCSSNAASCSTTIKFVQSSSTYTASCTGLAAGLQLNCTVNLSAASLGNTQLVVIVGGNTLTLPASPLLGGIIVTP